MAYKDKDKQRAFQATWSKQKAQQRRKAGLCGICGGKKTGKLYRCAKCRTIHLTSWAKYAPHRPPRSHKKKMPTPEQPPAVSAWAQFAQTLGWIPATQGEEARTQKSGRKMAVTAVPQTGHRAK